MINLHISFRHIFLFAVLLLSHLLAENVLNVTLSESVCIRSYSFPLTSIFIFHRFFICLFIILVVLISYLSTLVYLFVWLLIFINLESAFFLSDLH